MTTPRALPHWLQLAAVGVAALASFATSAVHRPYEVSHQRSYPAWTVVRGATASRGPLRLDLWVARSGKQGLGVTLRLTNEGDTALNARVAGARLIVMGEPRGLEGVGEEGANGRSSAPVGLRVDQLASTAQPLSRDGVRHVYLAFPFDNERAWNERRNRAQVELQLDVDGAAQPTVVADLEQRMCGFHRTEVIFRGSPPWAVDGSHERQVGPVTLELASVVQHSQGMRVVLALRRTAPAAVELRSAELRIGERRHIVEPRCVPLRRAAEQLPLEVPVDFGSAGRSGSMDGELRLVVRVGEIERVLWFPLRTSGRQRSAP